MNSMTTNSAREVDAEVMKALTVEEALALADALRLQAGVAAKLTEGVDA